MPFFLYDVATTDSTRQFTQGVEVSLAGNNGPLARLHSQKNPKDRWHASGHEIVATIDGGARGADVVIDLKPKDAKAVSLFRLLDVWGFSELEWTPVSLHLEALFVDESCGDPAEFKKSFVVVGPRASVGEFLYLQGGIRGGTWNWGLVGRVNGALCGRQRSSTLPGSWARRFPAGGRPARDQRSNL